MRASSSFVLLALLLGGCAAAERARQEAPPPQSAPVVVSPTPVEYSCADQKRLAEAFRALDQFRPDDAILIRIVIDYSTLRVKLRAALKLPDPPGCP